MDIAAAVATPAMPITAEALIAHRFLPLTEEEERRVDDVVYGPATDVKLIEKFATPMTRFKMVCLRPNTWLNDEVHTHLIVCTHLLDCTTLYIARPS